MKKCTTKKQTILLVLFLSLLGFFFSKCEDFDENRPIVEYIKQPRDKKLQGWWKLDSIYYPTQYIYFDVASGRERGVYPNGINFVEYWYTSYPILYRAYWLSTNYTTMSNYYQFDENDSILKISTSSSDFTKLNSTNIKFVRWHYITDTTELVKLKKYEFMGKTNTGNI